jgi:hypothetical protein
VSPWTGPRGSYPLAAVHFVIGSLALGFASLSVLSRPASAAALSISGGAAKPCYLGDHLDTVARG